MTRVRASSGDGAPSGVKLATYSPCAVGDSTLPRGDADIYKRMGEIGEAITGYPCASVYDAFPETDDRGRRSTSGGFIEWTYEHLGMFSFATELWDIQSRAGMLAIRPNRP